MLVQPLRIAGHSLRQADQRNKAFGDNHTKFRALFIATDEDAAVQHPLITPADANENLNQGTSYILLHFLPVQRFQPIMGCLFKLMFIIGLPIPASSS